MKAFLIDPEKKIVSIVDYDGDYTNIQKMIEAKYFTTVRINSDHDTVFVDDEGLYTDKASFMLRLKSYPSLSTPLKGKGLVLGVNDEGDSIEPIMSYEKLKSMIIWEIGLWN